MNMPAPLPDELLKAFESVPDRYLIISPELVILTASNAYLEITLTQREEIKGKYLLEVFADKPDIPQVFAVEEIKASLEQVLRTKQPHRMAHQQDDDSRPGFIGGGLEEKHWSLVNTPVLDEQGNIQYIIHQLQEITELVQQKNLIQQLEAQVASPSHPTPASTRPLAQAALESKELLQAVFNASMVGIAVFESVRSEAGEIIDFTYRLVNPVVEKIAGRPLVGCRYLELYPAVRNSGIFDAFVKVVETGQPTDFEQHYGADGFNQWFRMTAVKQDDGIVSTVEDITSRKQAEAERIKALKLLQQSEEVASMGSWEFDIATGAFNWSEGMYRLFGLPVGTPIKPEIYLDYVIEEDRRIAQKLVKQLRQAREPLDQTLRLQVDSKALTVRIKAVVLRNEQGEPLKMLGIDLDISEVKRLEEENLQLRLNQQKALLLAILEAQEEERRRISESLHNGVGQILYATKLNLDEVTRLVPKEALHTIEKLLSDAIDETRRVSHELVPVVLKDFGLREGIIDLCRKYRQSTFRLNCQVEGLQGPLESYLEIAFYRICQELINNIAKHAQATEASLHLSQRGNRILLQVQDNGKGITKEAVNTKGIGLRTIRDRVKLLNGTLTISKLKSGKGTLVIIRIPVET